MGAKTCMIKFRYPNYIRRQILIDLEKKSFRNLFGSVIPWNFE